MAKRTESTTTAWRRQETKGWQDKSNERMEYIRQAMQAAEEEMEEKGEPAEKELELEGEPEEKEVDSDATLTVALETSSHEDEMEPVYTLPWPTESDADEDEEEKELNEEEVDSNATLTVALETSSHEDEMEPRYTLPWPTDTASDADEEEEEECQAQQEVSSPPQSQVIPLPPPTNGKIVVVFMHESVRLPPAEMETLCAEIKAKGGTIIVRDESTTHIDIGVFSRGYKKLENGPGACYFFLQDHPEAVTVCHEGVLHYLDTTRM